MVECDAVARCSNYPNHRRWPMGDKSPKEKERQKKQQATEQDKKKADAYTKAHPVPELPARKGK